MPAARARRYGRQDQIWPGFVDALSTLLLVIIFLLVVFVLAQFFLGRALEGRDVLVERLREQVAELSQLLDTERQAGADTRASVAQLSADLRSAITDRDELSSRLSAVSAERAELRDRLALTLDERESLVRDLEGVRQRLEREEVTRAEAEAAVAAAQEQITADRETIEAQVAELVSLRRDIETLREVRADLEAQVSELAASLRESESQQAALREDLTAVRDRAQVLEARLSTEEERTALAQREIEERETRLEDLQQQLSASRERATDAEVQIEILNEQLLALRSQLTRISAALALKEQEAEEQETTIADLTDRLNSALAERVEELEAYRSEFFGRLRQVLGEREDVRVVGDRFVFQSEVLFETASAQLEEEGERQLAEFAGTLLELTERIPPEVPWVIQVNGHTDPRPVRSTARFESNWELSAQRAIEVAKFLIEQGVPPDRVAAAGFAEYQPVAEGNTPEAWAQNRRIELKLTTR
jgi:chemotaxis protein MotB